MFRHERRRRVFSDDAADVSDGPVGSGAAGAGQQANCYSDAAQQARQRDVATLVPTRLLSIGLIAGCGLLLVGLCLGLHFTAAAMRSWLPAEDVAFMRLDAPRSVSHWLASTLLALAGCLAVFIYTLRRHRVDDYHGRYRVWLWILALCLLASLAETTGLGRLARAGCRLAAESSSLRDDVLWPIACGLLASAVALRLFFEIRRSRGAVAALAGAGCCFLAAAALQAGWIGPWATVDQPLLARSGWLVGYVFLATTFLLYARYVQLGVSGQIAPASKPKRAKARQPAAAEAKATSAPTAKTKPAPQTDLESVETADVRSQREAPPTAAENVTPRPAETNAAAPESKQKLSKSQRRQLRRAARAAKVAS